ncbi:MAG TPA: O-antigen ligase family protein [Cyclobacteriaceae bacterium]|nr:O-antigen ligase family protein [Cyclobacteriaceae bacterium]
MTRPNYHMVYASAWWLCVVTLPLTIALSSASIILLVMVWLAEGQWKEKISRFREGKWVWPFLLFFGLHVAGLIYTDDQQRGLMEVEKKLSFFVLPLIAASGQPIDAQWISRIRNGFIGSCLLVVVISLAWFVFTMSLGPGQPALNFDPATQATYKALNPDSSASWEYLSYIQVGDWIDIHPAYFSMYLIFCIVMLLEEVWIKHKPWAMRTTIILLFICFIGLLSSRMAILALPIVITYLLTQLSAPVRHKLSVTGMVMVLLLIILWINPVSRFRVFQEPIQTSVHMNGAEYGWNSIRYRIIEWQAGWESISQSWLIGAGTGDGQQQLSSFYASHAFPVVALGYNAHNQYLQTSIELGMAGLMTLLVCMWPGTRPLAKKDLVHVAFVMLILLMCCTESMFARQKGIVFFTLFQSLFLRNGTNA